MKTNPSISFVLAVGITAVFVLGSVAGCDNKPNSATPVFMPEVNDANCASDNLAKMDASVRQQFADACWRRGSSKPSSGQKW